MSCFSSIRRRSPRSKPQRPAALGEPGYLERANWGSADNPDSLPEGDPNKFRLLHDIGNSFFVHFRKSGELGDLNHAILKHQEAVTLAPNDHPIKPICLHSLGNSLKARFERLGESSDLEQAISMQRKAVDLIPDGHPHKHRLVSSLGGSILLRFERFDKLIDLEEAISMHRRSVDCLPNGHPDKPRCLGDLSASLLIHFRRSEELCDLEQVIALYRDAVAITPDGDQDKPRCLANLGSSLNVRFRHTGELGNVDEAILALTEAVDLTPDGYTVKPGYLNNLGNSFSARFQRLGRLGDLEQAISRYKDAVNLTPDDHSEKPFYLDSLGSSLRVRFKHLGEPGDIEQAILNQGDAVRLSPVGHPHKHYHLNRLANSFITRFDRLSDLDDLEQAVSRYGDAIDLIPDRHPEKPTYLRNLGNALNLRFKRRRELSDLEQAILNNKEAINLIPDGHPDKPAYLDSLGSSFLARFEELSEQSDLEQAIARHEGAVDLTPDGHPNKPFYLTNLGDTLFCRFEHLKEPGDIKRGMKLCLSAACAPVGRTIDRFRASQRWIACARALRDPSLLHAYSIAIGLLPQLAWSGLPLTYRYHELIQGAGVVREAAAAAIDSGDLEAAVEWLEQGRSIVWGELFQLRSSYDELLAVHPDHANRLRQLSVALEDAGTAREQSLSFLLEQTPHTEHRAAAASLEHVADRHRKLAIERDTLLQEIRGLPGFERFLLHKPFSQLCASAHSGPVVILNAAESRCDALIISANATGVIHVPLLDITLGHCMGLQTSLKNLLGRCVMRSNKREGQLRPPLAEPSSDWVAILSVLWKSVAKPVLDALSYSTPGTLSRIFWCPTGPFTFLPIHAAGYYDAQHCSQVGHKTFDFVISSYVPTLSILLPSTEPAQLNVSREGDLRFLAVRQPSSDGLNHLPGVGLELEYIKAIIEESHSRVTVLESNAGTVEEVLALLKEADWVHVACHGVQDAKDPTRSGLCLANGRRLTLSEMMVSSRPRDGLAFLSACQTATGDAVLSDEAVHLAAGMLFVGYKGVIGTLWSINDQIAPSVAKDVYEQLFWNDTGLKPDRREAAWALHRAMGRLRASGASFIEWLPFIHVGL